MKKVLLFSAFAGIVSFYACKKESTVTVTNTVHDTTNTTIIKTDTVTVFASGKINGDTLATNITLAYGTKVSDATFPAASTDADAPVLDTSYSRTYQVVRSRYLTIYPPNVSGFVAGYYVQIVGAKSYFKVDYPEAEITRKAARQAANGRLSTKNISNRGYGEGYIDSVLVFKLPASVNGDTFYVKYAAYDASNRVSKPVTAMVVLLPETSAATSSALTGDWRYISNFYSNGHGSEDGRIDWSIDTGWAYFAYYNCDGTTLSQSETETDYHLPYTAYSNRWGYKLGKSDATYYYRQYYKNLNLENSTCGNLAYNFNYDYHGESAGGYSYDARSKKLTIIYDSYSNLSYDNYYLSELTDSTMILSDIYSNDDDNRVNLNKLIKQ